VKDRVIRGRIVDTQGKPVANVHVALCHLAVYGNNSLEPFLAEWKRRHYSSGLPTGVKGLSRNTGSILETFSDGNGRFALAGAGAERLVCIRLHGGGIADDELFIANRDGFDPKPYNEATRNNIPPGFDTFAPRWLLHGPDLSVIAEAEKPIRGVVTAADTGRPRAGIEVWLSRNGDSLLPLILSAKTDTEGRYEIRGARKANAYMVEVKSDAASGYLGCQVRAADTPGYQPVTADIRVAKGVVITGRVIDKTIGQPIPGFAMVGVLSDNPFVKEYPEFRSSAWMHQELTGRDGTFRIVTIPGPVLLMGGPDYRRLAGGWLGCMKYVPPIPDPKYPQYFKVYVDSAHYYGPGGSRSPLQGNFCKVLNIKPGTREVQQDIVFEQANAIPVKIQDADGRPVSGAWVTGISPKNWTRPVRISEVSCSAYHVTAAKPRLMAFYEPEKKLVGTLSLKGDEKQPAVAKLGPAGAVTGRLVYEDSKPVSGFVIEVYYPTREAQEMFKHIDRAKPRVVTDKNGAFRIENLIPGVEFKLDHHRSGRAPLRANPLAVC
jgi:protocatechuate 3,4-dioxygenase beta subunit